MPERMHDPPEAGSKEVHSPFRLQNLLSCLQHIDHRKPQVLNFVAIINHAL